MPSSKLLTDRSGYPAACTFFGGRTCRSRRVRRESHSDDGDRMGIAIGVVFTLCAAAATLASRHDIRLMRDYRARVTREIGVDVSAQASADARTLAKRELRSGKALSDPTLAKIL